MSNGALPQKWNTHTQPLPNTPALNSSGIEPQLAIQQNIYKNHKDISHAKQKPPDYYQYPHPRQPYPSYMYPQAPYDLSPYHIGSPAMQRRPNPEWSQWGQEMTPMVETMPSGVPQQEQTWPNEWGHHHPIYPHMYGPMYRGTRTQGCRGT
ncbi:hypothetical protein LOD99_1117 [Oopsacas minuta]|uniref:Uncharacterized protein n=1 Tax=Oopsacas minuta TaxID=111878 RepID=A0AAV7K4W4_9METZ|nr:hypothetical protein LOD99_1117 [Oopsacas minuta]